MPKTLHSSTGLTIVKNDRNGFVVATLHYSADPRKRGEAWQGEAAQGLSKAKFEQEYEISYDAMLGEKTFPEIRSRRSDIVLRTGPYIGNEWPRDLSMWAGFDYGTLNPSAFIVFTIIDGVTYAIWEMYEPCKNIIEFISGMKSCPYWDQLRYIAHDPSLTNLTQRDLSGGGMTTVLSQFNRLGVTRFLRGNTDEQAWLSQMQKHWCSPEITFKILESCPHLIEEFEGATYITMSERQLETQNFREQLVDKKNHAMDACKYFMNSSPSYHSRRIALPNLAAKFGFPSTHDQYTQTVVSKRAGRSEEWTFLK